MLEAIETHGAKSTALHGPLTKALGVPKKEVNQLLTRLVKEGHLVCITTAAGMHYVTPDKVAGVLAPQDTDGAAGPQ